MKKLELFGRNLARQGGKMAGTWAVIAIVVFCFYQAFDEQPLTAGLGNLVLSISRALDQFADPR